MARAMPGFALSFDQQMSQQMSRQVIRGDAITDQSFLLLTKQAHAPALGLTRARAHRYGTYLRGVQMHAETHGQMVSGAGSRGSAARQLPQPLHYT